jgi:DNA processing protein
VSPDPCDACLRRTWLLERLGPHVDRARETGRRLPLLLGLSDADLVAALAGGRRDEVVAGLAAFAPDRARAAIAGAGLAAVCRCDPRYPVGLTETPDAPAVLHVAGRLERLEELLGEPCVAVVGARRASAYGLEVARALGRGLSAAGVTVVSGLALGVDAAAHDGALDGGGRTVAVLAGGADRPYPATRRRTHARIVEVGAVISELPPGTRCWRWAFPARNRVIAGLAAVCVVVEAGERSGSLITTGIAEDLGRDVAAVPGQVTSSLAAGPNALIQAGAHLVRDAGDVLDLLFGAGGRPDPGPDPRDDLPAELRAVLDALGNGRDTVGALVAGGFELGAALEALSELELLGHVRRAPGGRFVPCAG